MSYLCHPLFVLNYLLLIACRSVIHVLCLMSRFFCRLKINQDSHEFILEFSTVANTSYCASYTLLYYIHTHMCTVHFILAHHPSHMHTVAYS